MHIEIRGAERLSRRERQVVALKEMGYSNGAIARRLGVGAGTVATLLQRARSKGYQVVIVLPGDPLGLFPEAGEPVDDHDGYDGDDSDDGPGADPPEHGRRRSRTDGP